MSGPPSHDPGVHLLAAEEVQAIAALQEAIRSHGRRIEQEWHRLYSALFGPQRALSAPLLRDAYVPLMGGALTCMARGDVAGFTDKAGTLGEEMARAGIDFAAVVAHLSLLKDCCRQALADEPCWRDRAPIILEKFNSSTLPRELVESELFGYKRGAFSGALADHVGLCRAASGGTLLLDEITEMGADLQAKLLRVLQEQTVRPVGSVAEEAINVRFIASTNRDPAAVCACTALRSDLYYRLSTSTLVVPPLRERGDDIVHLARDYLVRLQERYGHTVQTPWNLTNGALHWLRTHPWPGNVRELFNVLEDTFIAGTPLNVGAADLSLMTMTPVRATSDTGSDQQTFAASERALIARTLASTAGNKLRAARQLGISRKKLYSEIVKYALTVALLSQTAIVHVPFV